MYLSPQKKNWLAVYVFCKILVKTGFWSSIWIFFCVRKRAHLLNCFCAYCANNGADVHSALNDHYTLSVTLLECFDARVDVHDVCDAYQLVSNIIEASRHINANQSLVRRQNFRKNVLVNLKSISRSMKRFGTRLLFQFHVVKRPPKTFCI